MNRIDHASTMAPDGRSEIAVRLLGVLDDWRASLAPGAARGAVMARILTLIEQLRQDLERKPRVAILGEFNSGKTSLVNLLARTSSLPTSVLSNTRTVTLVEAAGASPDRLMGPMRALRSDSAIRPAMVSSPDLHYDVATSRAPLLEACTLIDTPGLSDPSFVSPVTARLAALSDLALWCSPATQCWKASERAAFDAFPARPAWRSFLVVTGADMLRQADDRRRILARLEAETGDRFGAFHLISAELAARALDACGEVRDEGLWATSGAQGLEAALIGVATAIRLQRHGRAGRWAIRLLRQLDRDAGSEPSGLLARLLWPARVVPGNPPDRLGRQEARALQDLRRRLRGFRPTLRKTGAPSSTWPGLAARVSAQHQVRMSLPRPSPQAPPASQAPPPVSAGIGRRPHSSA